MRRWSGGALGLGLGLALGLVVGEGAAAAGDRRVEILVVDMGIAGDPAAKSCVRDFVGRLGEEYTTVGRLGRAALVRRVGEVPAGGFLGWGEAELGALRERGDGSIHDAIVLVECEPAAARVDVLALAPGGGAVRIELRRVTVDRRRARWLADAVFRHALVTFSP